MKYNNDNFTKSALMFGGIPTIKDGMVRDYYRKGTPLPEYPIDQVKPVDMQYAYDCLDEVYIVIAEKNPLLALTYFMLEKSFVHGKGSRIGTMCIRLRKNDKGKFRLGLLINANFFTNFCRTVQERAAVIEHELWHVLLKHLEDRNIGEKWTGLQNIAMDLSINSIIAKYDLSHGSFGAMTTKYTVNAAMFPYIPTTVKLWNEWSWAPGCCEEKLIPVVEKGYREAHVLSDCCLPIDPDDEDFSSLPPHLSAKMYYHLLMKGKGKKGGDFDDLLSRLAEQHDWFEDVDPNEYEDADDEMKSIMNILRSHVRDYIAAGSGTIQIQRLLASAWVAQPDYQTILASFIASNQREREPSWWHENRRDVDGYCGHQYDNAHNVVVFVDQSGSMSDEHVAACFARLEGLLQYADITVYHFADTIDLNSKQEYESVSELTPRRTVTGGTSFQPVFDFMENQGHEFDVCFIMTDMGAPMPNKPINNVCFMYEKEPYSVTQGEVFRSNGHIAVEI